MGILVYGGDVELYRAANGDVFYHTFIFSSQGAERNRFRTKGRCPVLVDDIHIIFFKAHIPYNALWSNMAKETKTAAIYIRIIMVLKV